MSTNEFILALLFFSSVGVVLYTYFGYPILVWILSRVFGRTPRPPAVAADIVMLSDANTYTHASAAQRMAAWFADPTIGVVCGRLVLTDPKTGRNVDSLYWKYETFIKKCENRLGALLGSNGGIYAIRK